LVCDLVGTGRPMTNVSRPRVDMGLSEFESLCLDYAPLRDGGKVTVRLHSTDKKAPKAAVRLQEHRKLLEMPTSAPVATGRTLGIWMTFDAHGIEPGMYRYKLIVSPEKLSALSVPVKVKVWNVALPEERLTEVFPAFRSNAVLTRPRLFEKGQASPERYLKVYEAFVAEVAKVGNRTMGMNLKHPFWRKKIVRVGVKEGTIPVMDFSGLDAYVDAAVRHGADRAFFFGAGGLNKAWLDVGRELAEEERERQVREVWRQCVEYLKGRGIERVVFKVFDENAPEMTPAMERMLKRAKSVGPPVRTEGYLSALTVEFCRDISPYYDNWVHGATVIEMFGKWMREGKFALRPDQWLGFYVGASDPCLKYEYLQGRRLGWFACFVGVRYYHFCALYSDPRDAFKLVYLSPEGVVSTPGWEGLKDGATDWEYYAQLAKAIEEAKGRGGEIAERARKAEAELKRIIGNEGGSLIGREYVARQGYGFTQMKADASDLRRAKRKVLELLVDLKAPAE